MGVVLPERLFWEVWAPEGHMMTSGIGEQVREEIEEKLEDALGFFVMLEHSEDDTDENDKPIFLLYPHSDNLEDMTDKDLATLKTHSIDINGSCEENNKVICNILGITVTR
jgi:hypothetical protein